jgi:hypothetical protein
VTALLGTGLAGEPHLLVWEKEVKEASIEHWSETVILRLGYTLEFCGNLKKLPMPNMGDKGGTRDQHFLKLTGETNELKHLTSAVPSLLSLSGDDRKRN